MIEEKLHSLPISLLVPIYHRDNPKYFEAALKSLLHLTTSPDEVIVGCDGPLTPELDDIIERFIRDYPKQVTVIRSEENIGLGYIINKMAHIAKNEILARMDSDDLCRPMRFERQYNYLVKNKVDLIGGQVSEFKVNPGDLHWEKKVPLNHDEIEKYLKRRSPFTHPAIMFKKELILSVNGFKRIPPIEDYDFFVRCKLAGAKFGNVDEVVLDFRLGDGFSTLKRRRGMSYLKQEWYMYYKLFYKEYKYYNLKDIVFLTIFKLPLRLLPFSIFKVIYRLNRK
jgi:glycosyltransferase involved in cell wall biosynthesis